MSKLETLTEFVHFLEMFLAIPIIFQMKMQGLNEKKCEKDAGKAVQVNENFRRGKIHADEVVEERITDDDIIMIKGAKTSSAAMDDASGVKHPRPSFSNHQDNGERFVDEHHTHHTPSPIDWGLAAIERVDVNHVDIAQLMVVVWEEAEAVLANTKQILNQFLRKSRIP
ncbi:hypothetical protein Tco_0750949 [Tanacetum coccineum]|uniref:Uncharacterized protein n=1 Tax=Tanacetum coccineum TaxID=301880 RepID=A0ABQ4Z651_9ASTR